MSDDVFRRIDASWHTLLAAVDGVPEDALSTPLAIGEWSVKDVLAHVGFWKGSTADRAERVASGGPVNLPGNDEHWQVTNEREAAARAEWPASQVMNDLLAQHERTVAGLHRVPGAQFDDVLGDYIEHSDEHAAEIAEWRTAAGY
jgi:hypothetical protein